MKNNPWFALSLLLSAGPLQAQGTAPSTAKPAHKPPTEKSAPAHEAHAADSPAKPPAAAAATDKFVEWTLDPVHSHIGFVARHLGFTKTNGHFKKFTGTLRADPKTAKLASLEATVDTASIDTGLEKRDKHLRSDDFLNAEKFPQLKLVSKSIKWNGNKFTANVDLTIRDVTKPVVFKGELLGVHKVNFGQGEQLRAGYEASATINRKDFGLTWNMITEGLAVVADPVEIELAAEISYAPAAATTASAPSTTAPMMAAKPAGGHAAKPTPPTPPQAPKAPAAPVTSAKPATATKTTK